MPAPLVSGKIFFALRALCPRLRFTGEARQIFFFALCALCPRLRFTRKARKNKIPAPRALCPRLRQRKWFKVQTKAMRIEICALRVLCLCLSFTRKAGKKKICASRFATGYRENRLPRRTLASRPNVSGKLKSREHSFA